MDTIIASTVTAFWLGILTSISPCPLATNIAAISYIGKQVANIRRVLLFGVAYSIGRMLMHISGGPVVGAFWALIANTAPTLVVLAEEPGGPESLRVYRLLSGSGGDGTPAWRRRDADGLTVGTLPGGVTVSRYEDALGFNQQIVLLVSGSDGAPYLQLAGIGAAPTEASVALLEVFAQSEIDLRAQVPWQMLVLIVLIAIFAALFIFRRGSIMRPIEPPVGWAIALTFQRLLGWLIDLVPFGYAAARTLRIDGSEALRRIAELAIGSETRLPPTDVLIWWGLTIGGHTVYCLVMELITCRTVGKVLTGVRLLSDTGTRPSWWQVLTRNLTRLI